MRLKGELHSVYSDIPVLTDRGNIMNDNHDQEKGTGINRVNVLRSHFEWRTGEAKLIAHTREREQAALLASQSFITQTQKGRAQTWEETLDHKQAHVSGEDGGPSFQPK